jgi:hypothetical protein
MSKKEAIPRDIKQELLWIVRGYPRRVRTYHEARRDIIEGAACNFVDTKGKDKKEGVRVFLPRSGGIGRPSESKFDQLDAIESWAETQKMRAVEHAKLRIGLDLENEELRQRLAEGIELNCNDRHTYPYQYLNLSGIEKTDFYKRRDEFLLDVAEYLHMM